MTGWRAGVAALLLTLAALLPAEARTLRILAFGDSLMQSYGVPPQESLPAQLESWLRDRGRDVAVINAGVAGDTTGRALNRLGLVLKPRPDAVIVSLGGNDAFRGVPVETVQANLAAILRDLRSRSIPVLLVGVQIPSIYGRLRYNDIWHDVAIAEGVPLYPNFYRGILRGLSTPFDAPRYLIDGIHPNAAGVALVVGDLGPAVEAILPR